MADSDFWRELAKDFLALDSEERIYIQLEPGSKWRVMGDRGLRGHFLIQFSALARRAGSIIDLHSTLSLEDVW